MWQVWACFDGCARHNFTRMVWCLICCCSQWPGHQRSSVDGPSLQPSHVCLVGARIGLFGRFCHLGVLSSSLLTVVVFFYFFCAFQVTSLGFESPEWISQSLGGDSVGTESISTSPDDSVSDSSSSVDVATDTSAQEEKGGYGLIAAESAIAYAGYKVCSCRSYLFLNGLTSLVFAFFREIETA